MGQILRIDGNGEGGSQIRCRRRYGRREATARNETCQIGHDARDDEIVVGKTISRPHNGHLVGHV